MKKSISIIAAVCAVVSLTACAGRTKGGSVTSAEFKPTLDTNTECSISVVGSYDNFEALEAEFDRFNEMYPNVRFSYMKLDDYYNILDTVLESNDSPNIFFTNAGMFGNEKYTHIFEHTENLADATVGLNLDCIRPGLINRDEQDRVMMVPIFSRSYGMLVNNDLFEKEGLSIPTTWTELMEVCDKFRNKGYSSPMMGYSADASSCLMYTVAYPMFVATLADNPEALALANDLDPAAGEFMRPALETVQNLIGSGCVDLNECDKIKDNYTEVILRFFEGDVPMMLCAGDTVSGTRKRESQSEAFTNSPFTYTFYPIPLTDDGGYFIDSPSVEFAVNKDCDNLEMTNEFMRFLISNKELNEMASVKRLVTPTADLSFDSVYAPFGKISAERTISPEVVGITDALTVQIKFASYQVGKGEITVDEAVANYGTYE